MNDRVERLILAAVLTGAVALAGCFSGGGGGSDNDGAGDGGNDDGDGDGGGTDGDPPTLVSASTLDSGRIELVFSGPVQIGDPDAALSMFTLNQNKRRGLLNFIDGETGTCHSTYDGTFYNQLSCLVSGTYSYSDYAINGTPISLVSLSVSTASPETVLLHTALLPDDSDHGTGMLRLTYAAGDSGITNAEGTALEDITLEASDPGNVLDTLGAPALLSARTISGDTIELFFSEEVQFYDASPETAAEAFKLTANCVHVRSATNDFYFAYFSSSTYDESDYYRLGSSLSIHSDDARYADLVFDGAFHPIYNYRGYLRLTRTESSSIRDTENQPLGAITLSGDQRGNVVDDVAVEPANCFYATGL